MSINYDQKKQHLLKTGEKIFATHGFTGIGLTELLRNAEIPKGSFYYYFRSKEDFAVEVIQNYIERYITYMKDLFANTDFSVRERLLQFWMNWQHTQCLNECEGRCLIVKLSCEVADLSTPMRQAFCKGVDQITTLITDTIQQAQHEHSVILDLVPDIAAKQLYQQWLGASLIVKLQRNSNAFQIASDFTNSVLRAP